MSGWCWRRRSRPTAHRELVAFMDTAERIGCFPAPCWVIYSERNDEAWLRLISDGHILAQIKVVRP